MPALASQGLVLRNTDRIHGFIPSGDAGWSSISDFRIEGQIDSCTIPPSVVGIFQLNIQLRMERDGSMYLRGFNNEVVGSPIVADCSNIRFRARRDVAAAVYSMETWNEQTGIYAVSTVAMTDTARKNLSNANFNVGNQYEATGPTMRLGALRIYSSAGSLGAAPPNRLITSGYGDLLDYEFENNLSDRSGHGISLVYDSGSASYAALRSLPPVVSLTTVPTTIRAGAASNLNIGGFSNADSPTLTCSLRQSSGPMQGIFSSHSSCTTTFTAPVFGQYDLVASNLDATGLRSSSNFSVGAVATDDSGVVSIPDPNINRILGPMIRHGANPWSWFDNRAIAVAEQQLAFQSSGGAGNGYWKNVWDVASPHGTVSAKFGEAVAGTNRGILHGSDTQFQTDFCGGPGNTTPVSATGWIVVWYPSSDYPGTTGRSFYTITSCDSQTELQISHYWGRLPGTTSGMQYSVINPADVGMWLYSSTPGNYYDNVLAFYSLYYRSGLTKYRDAARTLAHNFWYGPFYDRGAQYNSAVDDRNIYAGPTRGQSLTGLVVWALESGENIWPGIHYVWDFQKYVVHDYAKAHGWVSQIGDIRESGYGTAALALCAQYDADPGYRATCRVALKETINNLWVPLQVLGPDGQTHWRNTTPVYGTIGNADGSTYVTTTKGSANIVLHGATWTSYIFSEKIWFFNNPADQNVSGNSNEVGDNTFYTATFVDATHATLDRLYEGNSGNHGMLGCNFAGFGNEPFMQGIWGGQAGSVVYDALIATGDTTEANIVKQFSIGSAKWLINNATDASKHALYYAVEFLNCDPPGANPSLCGAGPAVNGEALKNFTVAYLHSGDPAIKAAADSFYSRMWCKPKGGWTCGAAGYADYMWDIDNEPGSGGYMLMPNDPLSNKWFGFFFGYGAGAGWPASRVGGLAAPAPLTITLPHILTSVANAVKIRITLLAPNGVSSSSTCTSTPCQVTVDSRLGQHMMKIEYLSVDDEIVGPGEFVPCPN